jgi:hypothetical protein
VISVSLSVSAQCGTHPSRPAFSQAGVGTSVLGASVLLCPH